MLNVCSGTGLALGDLVSAVASALGAEVDAQIDPELAAIAAAPRVVGDPDRCCGFFWTYDSQLVARRYHLSVASAFRESRRTSHECASSCQHEDVE